MSDTSNETVREVCKEIREVKYLTGHTDLNCFLYDIAERILAAYERDMAAKDAEIARLKEQLCHDDGLITTMSLEIVRLKAALKPVMAVNMNMGANYSDMFFAVRKSQRIMKEGENNG